MKVCRCWACSVAVWQWPLSAAVALVTILAIVGPIDKYPPWVNIMVFTVTALVVYIEARNAVVKVRWKHEDRAEATESHEEAK